MRGLGGLILVTVLASALPVMAGSPESSLRPAARSESGSATQVTAAKPTATPTARASSADAPPASVRPELRPKTGGRSQASGATAASVAGASTAAVVTTRKKATNKKPDKEPKGLFRKRKLRKGSVCGVVEIQGDKIGRVAGSRNGCGVADAVKVRSVSGVMLSQPAVMDCNTAKALNTWVDKGLQPAFKRRGKVVEMKVAAHYICRTRNNKRGAKISEHGKGKAIDISAFTMKDGKVYTVQESWWRGRAKKPLRQAYAKACGPFGTTLGPTADSYHQDHFHFDTASYRSGPYCK